MVAQSKILHQKPGTSTRRIILELKREYAKTFYDRWLIISAEHGLVPPWRELESYNTHIDDRDIDDFISQLAGGNFCSVTSATIGLEGAGEVHVLAGKKYCNAMKEACRLNDQQWDNVNRPVDEGRIAPKLSFPFQEANLSGIGEQISWLQTALEEHIRRPGGRYKGQVGMDRYQDTVIKK